MAGAIVGSMLLVCALLLAVALRRRRVAHLSRPSAPGSVLMRTNPAYDCVYAVPLDLGGATSNEEYGSVLIQPNVMYGSNGEYDAAVDLQSNVLYVRSTGVADRTRELSDYYVSGDDGGTYSVPAEDPSDLHHTRSENGDTYAVPLDADSPVAPVGTSALVSGDGGIHAVPLDADSPVAPMGTSALVSGDGDTYAIPLDADSPAAPMGTSALVSGDGGIHAVPRDADTPAAPVGISALYAIPFAGGDSEGTPVARAEAPGDGDGSCINLTSQDPVPAAPVFVIPDDEGAALYLQLSSV